MARFALGPTAGLLALVVDSALVVGLTLGTFGPVASVPPPHLDEAVVGHSETNASSTGLTVDPASYWLRTGSNVTFRAVWSTLLPLCRIVPLWYSWSLAGSNITGFLNATTGPSATFVAASFASGTSDVDVRSDAVLDCGGNEAVVDRTGVANVSVAVPLSVRDVGVTPDPLLPGENATLRGTVEGGEPPYSLVVAWGDDTRTVFVLSAPGAFSLNHSFAAGEFTPSLLVSDSAGNLVNISVDESIGVGTGLEVGIIPSSSTAEVGIPVDFAGIVSGLAQGTTPLFDCSNATNSVGTGDSENSSVTVFSCTFTSVGPQVVLFGAYPVAPGAPTDSVVLVEQVNPTPRISIEPLTLVDSAGNLADALVSVSGGVLPLALTWTTGENQSGGNETLESDGQGIVGIVPEGPGAIELTTRLIDSLGITSDNTTPPLDVYPQLDANVTGNDSVIGSEIIAGVQGVVYSGCAPFFWWVVPAYPPLNSSAENGSLAGVSDFDWSAFYALEGSLPISVVLLDGCGDFWEEQFSVPLFPPLLALVAASPVSNSSNDAIGLNLSIRGGNPPFDIELSENGNETWNLRAVGDGRYHWLFAVDGPGTYPFSVAVSDSLGTCSWANVTVIYVSPGLEPIGPSPTPPSPPITPPKPAGDPASPSITDVGLLLIPLAIPISGAIIVLCVRLRHDRKIPQSGRPNATAALRKVFETVHGIERHTVEKAAEAEGIPHRIVKSTIDQLVSSGTIRSENRTSGDERLSWTSDGD